VSYLHPTKCFGVYIGVYAVPTSLPDEPDVAVGSQLVAQADEDARAGAEARE